MPKEDVKVTEVYVLKLSDCWVIGILVKKSKTTLVKYPLVFKYVKNESLAGVGMDFSIFDVVIQPTQIEVFPLIMYPVNDNVFELYLKNKEKLYGSELPSGFRENC